MPKSLKEVIVNHFSSIYRKCNTGTMAEKLGHPLDFPRLLDIELTNECNLRCAMCPTGQGIAKRSKGIMSAKTFGTILKEAAYYGAALRFVRWGEPFLHPQCLAFCKLARSVGVQVWINTNGALIDDDTIEQLIHLRYGPTAVKFSFQGVTREQYEKWRGEDNFERLLETIGKLHKARGAFKIPFIQIGTTVTDKSTDEEVSEFKARAEKIADKVEIGGTRKIGIDSCGLVSNCPEVFDKLSINWDGTIVACCSDYDNQMVVGNIDDRSIKNTWDFGAELREIRENLANGLWRNYRLCGGSCYDAGDSKADESRSGQVLCTTK